MEARSKQFWIRFNAAVLRQIICFYIPAFQSNRSGDKQFSSGKCRKNYTTDLHMVDKTLVHPPTKNVHTTSIGFTSPTKPITKSPGIIYSCENQVSKVSSVKNYKKTLEMERISINAARLISMSRRPG